jgi:hypothetical protein
VISSNNVSRLLAFAYKFQLTTLTILNRSPLSIRIIPIVYVVSVRRLVPSAVNQSLVVALVLKRLNYGNAAAGWSAESYLHRRLLSILVGHRPVVYIAHFLGRYFLFVGPK